MYSQNKIRRASTRHDTIDFQPLIIIRSSEVLVPISVTVADKGYDSEGNHQILVKE